MVKEPGSSLQQKYRCIPDSCWQCTRASGFLNIWDNWVSPPCGFYQGICPHILAPIEARVGDKAFGRVIRSWRQRLHKWDPGVPITRHYVRLQQVSSVQPERVLLEPDRVTPVSRHPDSLRTVKNTLLLLSYLVYGNRLEHPSTYPKLGYSQSTLTFLKFCLVSIKWYNTTPGNRLLSKHFCSWLICLPSGWPCYYCYALRCSYLTFSLWLFGGWGCV